MKKINTLLLLLSILLIAACSNEVSETITYKINEPILMAAEDFRKSANISASQKISKVGEIVVYDAYLYISEPEKGIHIIDNRNAASPRNVGFINLPGNMNLAVNAKNNILYADSYVDLVWFDISNPLQPKWMERKKDVFPTVLPATNNGFGVDYEKIANKATDIVVGWTVAERSGEYPSGYFYYNDLLGGNRMELNSSSGNNLNKTTETIRPAVRFTIDGDFLYAGVYNQMNIYSIAPPIPEKKVDFSVGSYVEDILCSKDKIVLSTSTGLLVYSFTAPERPTKINEISFIKACNPIAIENDVVFATINSTSICGQKANELRAYSLVNSIENNKAPLATLPMKNPQGLAVLNGLLFVCDEGLKIFDAKNPTAITQLIHKSGINGSNILINKDIIMVINSIGIQQYRYTDIKNIEPLSTIPIVN